jgi:hypothetical protein
MNTFTELDNTIIDQKTFSYLFEDNKFTKTVQFNNDKSLVHSICLLNFDDSIGQVAESIWPENSLDKITLKQITGLGFPETNMIVDSGENKFIFKIRKSNYTVTNRPPHPFDKYINFRPGVLLLLYSVYTEKGQAV